MAGSIEKSSTIHHNKARTLNFSLEKEVGVHPNQKSLDIGLTTLLIGIDTNFILSPDYF